MDNEILMLEALADNIMAQVQQLKQRCHNLRTKGEGESPSPRKGKRHDIQEKAAKAIAKRNSTLKISQ